MSSSSGSPGEEASRVKINHRNVNFCSCQLIEALPNSTKMGRRVGCAAHLIVAHLADRATVELVKIPVSE